MAIQDSEKRSFTHWSGPKKVQPFDSSVLDTEIQLLDHGVKRSAGTTDLYRRYCLSVSRRELGWMVKRVRQDLEADTSPKVMLSLRYKRY
jgi:hypothetical protein